MVPNFPNQGRLLNTVLLLDFTFDKQCILLREQLGKQIKS